MISGFELDYDIGQNDASRVSEIDLSMLMPDDILAHLSDCLGSNEIILFHKLLQLPQTRGIAHSALVELFFLACTAGKLAHVLALIEHGIDPNTRSASDESALGSAAAWGNDAVVFALLHAGARMRSTGTERNEELDLLLANCAKDTISEALADTQMLATTDSVAQIAKRAADCGR